MRESCGFSVRYRGVGGRPEMHSFREWLLLDEARKAADLARELLGGDESLLAKIQAILPTKVPTKMQGKILALAAYFYADMRVKDLNSLRSDIADYARLVNDNKMPVLSVGDDLRVDNPHLSSHLGWSEVVHAKIHEDKARSAPPPQGDVSDQELVAKSDDGRIRVYKANSVNACIILGQGEKFCISQPGNTNFQGYRDTQTSTFYFVYDDTRTDDLARVVVDVTEKRGVLLTDRKNDTGNSIQNPFPDRDEDDEDEPNRVSADPYVYFGYLRGKGVDTSVFKNIRKSPEEEAEQAKLGKTNPDKDWFVSLSPEEKSKYIGRGHRLSDAQFQFIWDNKLRALLTQYARLGSRASNYQFGKIASDPDLKKTYLRARLIASRFASQGNWLSPQEYELMSKEQKEAYLEPGVKQRLAKALVVGDPDAVKELIELPDEHNSWSLKDDPMDLALDFENADGSYGKPEVIKVLLDVGFEVHDDYVEIAAERGSVEAFKLLFDKLKSKEKVAETLRTCEEIAYKHNNMEVFKYIRDYLSRTSPAAS